MYNLRTAIFKYAYLLITAAWLYTFSFIVSNYLSYQSSPKKVQARLETQITKGLQDINNVINDTALVSDCLNDKTFTAAQLKLINKPFGFFVYAFNDVGNPIISYWNSNSFTVKPEDLQNPDGNFMVHYQNGDFALVKKIIRLQNRMALCVGMLPVHWQYFIENKYLPANFPDNPGLDENYEISIVADALPVHDNNGKELFSIKLKGNKNYYSYDLVTIVLRTSAVILLLLFINFISVEILPTKGFRRSFTFLIAILLLLRLFSYQLNFPFNFSELSLFNPAVYASNFINPSLGDLLINTVIFFWLINFYRLHHVKFAVQNSTKKYYPFILLAIITLTCLALVNVIRSLVIDSKVSFDVTDFFSLTAYSYISFTILCLLALSFFYLTNLLIKPVIRAGIHYGIQALVVCLTGLLYFSFNIGNAFVLPGFFVLLWILLFLFILNYRSKDVEEPIVKSSLLVFWMMFFAVSMSAMLIYQNKEVEMQQRKGMAELLSLQSSRQEESLLSIAANNFTDTFLQKNFHRFYAEYPNKFLKDSLISENFSGYLNKYETRIYTYDSAFQPVYNDDSTKYAAIKTLQLNQAKLTDDRGFYAFTNKIGQTSYLLDKQIVNDKGGISGYLFVLIKPKKFISEALFPVLFKQGKNIVSDVNTHYAYALYNSGKLVSHENEYAFPLKLQPFLKKLYGYEEKINNGFSELWYYASNDKQIVIVKENNAMLQFVTLFAYLLTSFLIIVILYYVVNFLIKARFNIKTVRQFFLLLNIRSQINLIIVGICFISFVVIGIATVSFFIVRFNNTNEERLFKSIRQVADEIQERVNAQYSLDDVLTINDIGLTSDLEKRVTAIAETHNVDINFYNLSGKIRISTQPYIYNKFLLSDKMQPQAYYQLHYQDKYRYAQTENIGKLSFLSLYIPLTNEEGKEYGYLNIPNINSQAELNEEISGFLATLINLNAFIFLLAGAVAFIVTNRITYSFSLISDKMRDISLGKVNEKITWERNDEIGALVTEYNKMVNKLEASATALAKAERESAWREMARQVAHEIKNPLTPMKLSIQYLQRSMEAGHKNIKALSQQVAETLVEQIDQLSNIAGDFSQFANINNAKPEQYDVTETINSVVNMHQTNAAVNIVWQKPEEPCFVEADKTQMNRLFTNLIKNAVEAPNTNDTVELIITQKKLDGFVQISIQDNGDGIDETIQSKIFTPNFTTKSSGTGLGLAICKGIVENANGKIYFTTQQNKGTIFYVELPLVE